MFKANDFWSQEHSAQQLPYLSCMSASLDHAQQECLPACFNPGICMLNKSRAWPGSEVPVRSGLNLLQVNAARGFHSLPPIYFQNSLPTSNVYFGDKLSVSPRGFSGKTELDMTLGSSGKKYLIFDQCGNNMKMMCSSLHSPFVNPSTAAAKHAYGCNSYKELEAAKAKGIDSMKPTLHEEYDENHVVSGEGSEMHEDTEEINALLYSDDDEDHQEDDEVMSTGHSPNVPKRTYEDLEQFEDIADEADSYCGPNKRQKVPHDQYKKAMPLGEDCAVNLKGFHDYQSDAESNIQEENMNSFPGNEPSKTTKIRETLKMLEFIVPGAEGKDPSLVIDEAIDYLKSLKHRAMALGVHYN